MAGAHPHGVVHHIVGTGGAPHDDHGAPLDPADAMGAVVRGAVAQQLQDEASVRTLRGHVRALAEAAKGTREKLHEHDKQLRDCVAEPRFQAGLLLKANTSEVRLALQKLQAALEAVQSRSYSRDEVDALLKKRVDWKTFQSYGDVMARGGARGGARGRQPAKGGGKAALSDEQEDLDAVMRAEAEQVRTHTQLRER